MYFVNANGKIVTSKHNSTCKCQYCHRASTRPSYLSTFLLIIILVILFYYIWCLICKMKKMEVPAVLPQTVIPSAPPADGGRVNYLL